MRKFKLKAGIDYCTLPGLKPVKRDEIVDERYAKYCPLYLQEVIEPKEEKKEELFIAVMPESLKLASIEETVTQKSEENSDSKEEEEEPKSKKSGRPKKGQPEEK